MPGADVSAHLLKAWLGLQFFFAFDVALAHPGQRRLTQHIL